MTTVEPTESPARRQGIASAHRPVGWAPSLFVLAVVAGIAERAAGPISHPDNWCHLRPGNDLIAQFSLPAAPRWSPCAATNPRVFNSSKLGGSIAWRHPGPDRHNDGPITPYPTAHLERYRAAESVSRGWYMPAAASPTTCALLGQGSTLVAGLKLKGWRTVQTGGGYVLHHSPGETL